jgi:hypothetical protein
LEETLCRLGLAFCGGLVVLPPPPPSAPPSGGVCTGLTHCPSTVDPLAIFPLIVNSSQVTLGASD